MSSSSKGELNRSSGAGVTVDAVAERYYGNNHGLAIKLKQLRHKERKVRLLNGITPEMIEYVTHSFAKSN